MSRSYRHTPIIGVCSGSDKKDKRFARKAWRRRCNQLIQSTAVSELDALILPTLRQLSSTWHFNKDGKMHYGCPIPPRLALLELESTEFVTPWEEYLEDVEHRIRCLSK